METNGNHQHVINISTVLPVLLCESRHFYVLRRGAAAGALSCGAWGGFWGLCNGSVVGCSASWMSQNGGCLSHRGTPSHAAFEIGIFHEMNQILILGNLHLGPIGVWGWERYVVEFAWLSHSCWFIDAVRGWVKVMVIWLSWGWVIRWRGRASCLR